MLYRQFKTNQMKNLSKTVEVSGTPPLTLTKSKGKNLKDYEIYGNSVQDGTPTPTEPIEIESVGDLLIPSEYQQVEYLESTGTQHIITTFIPTSDNAHIKFKAKRTARLNNGFVYGIADFISYALCVNEWHSGGAKNIDVRYRGVRYAKDLTEGELYVEHTLELVNNNVYFNNELITTFSPSKSLATNTGFLSIFNRTGFTTNTYCGKIYSFEYYEDDVAKLNLIPCYRKSDNVAGMYDLVNNVFYTNQGSGNDFIVGANNTQYKIPIIVSNKTNVPIVELPSEYQQVEWLKSSRSQYIDLNYYPNYKTHIITDIQFYNTTGEQFFGCGLQKEYYPECVNFEFGFANSGFASNIQQGKYVTWATASFRDLNRHTWDLKSGSQKIDDVEYGNQTMYETSLINPYPFRLFNRKVTWAGDNKGCYAKLYSFTIYENNIKLIDLIPCYRKSDNVAGMYDIVNNVFYTNKGTGEFTIGDDVNYTKTNIYLNEPLRKIGTYADYIDFKNQKLVRYISKYSITGSELWRLHPSISNWFYVTGLLSEIVNEETTGLCQCYKYSSAVSRLANGEFNTGKPNFLGRVVFKDTRYTTVEDFKTWLTTQYNDGTPVIVEYPLATPTEESITLPNILTLKGTNIVSVGTTINASNMLVKYIKS